MGNLRYEVLVNDGVRRQREMRLPDGSPIVSSPVASTLVLGDNAVLVDPPFTYEQIDRVRDWIERSGTRLAYIRTQNGWRIAGIQRRFTHAESLSDAWAAADDEDPR